MTSARNVLRIQSDNSWLLTTDREFKQKLATLMRARPKNYFHNAAYKKKKWDGWKYFFNEKSGQFLTGLLPEVQQYLDKVGFAHHILDERKATVPFLHESIGDTFLNNWLPDGYDPIKLHDYQPDLVNQIMKYKRGIIQAPTGCHRRGQRVLMFDGSLKEVEAVTLGDRLMGPDGRPRTVLRLCGGQDSMYEIRPTKGNPFVVNTDHVLTLVRVRSHADRYPSDKGGEIVDVTVREWLTWSQWKKHTHKLIRSGVEFPKEYNGKLDPYFVGLLLGDGSLQHVPALHNINPVLIVYAQSQAEARGLVLKTREQHETSLSHFFVGKKGRANPLANELREIGLWNIKCSNKYVPHQLKTASRQTRMALLAGILDTDGYKNRSNFEITVKSQRLAEDIQWIAKSLGFWAKLTPTTKTCQTRAKGIYYRVSVCGNTSEIPCRVKQSDPRRQKKNVLRSGFSVAKVSELEDFYGFHLDGDHRYLLDDFTITHNSGKTFILISLIKCLPKKTPILFITKNSGLVHQNYEEMKLFGVENLGRWYGDYKEPNFIMCCTQHPKTFESLERLLPKFRVLIVDEVHNCMSDVPVKAYQKMTSADIRVGFSATPKKYDKKKIDRVEELKVKGHFGPIILTNNTETGLITTKELQARGILSASECFFYPIEQPDIVYEPYADAVKLGIEENFYFHRVIQKLARSCPGRTLVIVERIAQGEYLKQLLPEADWMYGDINIKDRQPMLERLRTSPKQITVAMRHIITDGINVKVHDLINAAGGDAAHNLIQQMGRGLRTAKDKVGLRFHDFHFLINDYLRKHSEWRMAVLANEGHKVNMMPRIELG